MDEDWCDERHEKIETWRIEMGDRIRRVENRFWAMVFIMLSNLGITVILLALELLKQPQ